MMVELSAFVPALFIGAIMLRTITCYYFRFLLRRYAFLHPTHCDTRYFMCDENPKGVWRHWPFSWLARLLGKGFYLGDSKLFYYHKYFIWLTVILMPFHLRETIPVFVGALRAGTLDAAAVDIGIEMAYVLAGVMFILSCHSIKYFFDRTSQKCRCKSSHALYHGFENANHGHALWLWVTIVLINIRLAWLLTHGTNVFTAMLMLFVRVGH